MISRRQIKMARTALGWGVRDLAAKARLAVNTVSRVENGAETMEGTLRKMKEVFEAEGIDFPDRTTVTVARLEDKERRDHPA